MKSPKTSGINYNTKHFRIEEFNSSQRVNGWKYQYLLSEILDHLEQVRSKAGNIPMKINSGFRNPYKHHNILGAKSKESSHIYGKAADIRLEDFNRDGETNDQDRFIITKPAKVLGACVEPKKNTPTWIHLDWRGACPPNW